MGNIGILKGNPKDEWLDNVITEGGRHAKLTNLHADEFREIEAKLDHKSLQQMLDTIKGSLPQNAVILDFSHSYGLLGSYLTEGRSDVQVLTFPYSIHNKCNRLPPMFIFREYRDHLEKTGTPNPQLEFLKPFLLKKGARRAEEMVDNEDVVNEVLHLNGLDHITYNNWRLNFNASVNGSLPDYLENLRGKDVYIVGHQAPKEWSFLLGNLYLNLEAKKLLTSPVDLGRTQQDSFAWDDIGSGLKLFPMQRIGFRTSAFDSSQYEYPGKYPYQNIEDMDDHAIKRIGVTIKLAIALGLAAQLEGNVTRNTDLENRGWWGPDHYVTADRKP
tara:strand:+ start:5077 stop:6066 length:990 start_codon:yes stop_codon:yes gene_type:complete